MIDFLFLIKQFKRPVFILMKINGKGTSPVVVNAYSTLLRALRSSEKYDYIIFGLSHTGI